jgi:ligand-binding SRPBCC domain-containing protein
VGQEVHLIVKHFKLIPTEMHMKFVDFEYPCVLSDTQLKGPFKTMIQRRVFEDIGDGYTRMTDYFQYELPFGVFGLFAHILFVESMIKSMFIFRQNATKKILESN